jgi:hypothetical protein
MDKDYIDDSHFIRRWFGYDIDFEVTVTSYRCDEEGENDNNNI